MNPTPDLPPPPRPVAGCFGVGCMSFGAFFVFLAVVFVVGGLWAVHYLRKYSSKTPLPIGQEETVTSSNEAPSEPTAPTSESAPVGVRPKKIKPEPVRRWETFEKAAERNEPGRIELTAADINALLNNSNARGKASVRIENNTGYVTVSIPLKGVMFMNGRYLNGHATVQASPDGDPAKLQVSNIVVGNESVSDDFLDRHMFGSSSIREMMLKWLNEQNISAFRIENDRAIGETRG